MGLSTHQAELVGETRRQDGVGELLLLTAGLAARVGECSCSESSAATRSLAAKVNQLRTSVTLVPAADLVSGAPGPALQSAHDLLDLQELRLGVLVVP